MTLGSRRTIVTATAIIVVWLIAVAMARGQGAAGQKPLMAEDVFKNVQVLKGIPVNEFMGTMGIFSAALGMSCEDCHTASDRGWEVYAADTNPRKRTARRMVLMMAEINRANFGGRQVVTCYTCHRASDRPVVTPNLSTLYAERPSDVPDIIAHSPAAPPVEQVFDNYIRALGWDERLATVTSFIEVGASAGY